MDSEIDFGVDVDPYRMLSGGLRVVCRVEAAPRWGGRILTSSNASQGKGSATGQGNFGESPNINRVPRLIRLYRRAWLVVACLDQHASATISIGKRHDARVSSVCPELTVDDGIRFDSHLAHPGFASAYGETASQVVVQASCDGRRIGRYKHIVWSRSTVRSMSL